MDRDDRSCFAFVASSWAMTGGWVLGSLLALNVAFVRTASSLYVAGVVIGVYVCTSVQARLQNILLVCAEQFERRI